MLLKSTLLGIVLICFIILIFQPIFALAEQTYVFERIWPTLQQPWYFNEPRDLAVGQNGNVYIADQNNHRIVVFTADGKLVTQWGSEGFGDGQFYQPSGIDIADNGNVYVSTNGDPRVQVFTSDGRFLFKWGEHGTEQGQFDWGLTGLAIGPQGNIYITDTGNCRIQVFSSDGTFIQQWGSKGRAPEQFNFPEGVDVDSNGNIYVADTENHRIQVFNLNGNFVREWGSHGNGPGELDHPEGIMVNSGGEVYVADSYNYRIQVFDRDGTFLRKWGDYGFDNGDFIHPSGIAIDQNHSLYITDRRVQKFTANGTFLTEWSSAGTAPGFFREPNAIALDGDGNLYVVDTVNYRIQKFDSNGMFLKEWGREGQSEGEFESPYGIAVDDQRGIVYVATDTRIHLFSTEGVFLEQWGKYYGDEGYPNEDLKNPYALAVDSNGNVYVGDIKNSLVQKFDSNGKLIVSWGGLGSGDGEFGKGWYGPSSLAFDAGGNVYVVDHDNHRIQVFSPDGQFITKWGQLGDGEGKFIGPNGIAIDGNGYIYVVEDETNRVQIFDSDLNYVIQFGKQGTNPGQMNQPKYLAVNQNGSLFISDYGNNRIQKFHPITQSANAKAIIVAGGGPFTGNNLWDATQMCANFAYRTLTYQGFTKESIYYLTSDTDLDLDSNGETDDVDEDSTNTNLQHAITIWAADADSLILYFVDHGGNGSFRMSGIETLSASELDSWLDSLQTIIDGKVIVIYDACESGSFMSALMPPDNKERIVIASTSPGESAYFVSQGTVSFSNYFWTNIFNGLDVKNAFDLAKDAIQHTTDYQNPLLDANNNGTGNEAEDYTLARNIYIGNGTIIQGDVPVIGNVSDLQIISGSTSALLFASNVTDDDGIDRVWATIRPPDYSQESPDNPVQNLPLIDLMSVGGNRYEVTYDGFNIAGSYQIAIYARDRIGNASIPKLTTVSVENPLRRRAVIVAGGDQSATLWPAIETCAGFAYEALTFQGYMDDDIYFLSPITFSTGVDGTPTISNLNYAITTWAQESTQDVVLYLVGNGGLETFQINETESLLPSDLDEWLDTLQNAIPGKVTVVFDANRSGSFLSSLVPPSNKERILISSTDSDGPAYFPIDGNISFSSFFWRQILNGANVRDAFVYTINAVGYACQGQEPELDDNGNGLGNEQGVDGRLARDYTIGTGIMLAGDEPLIGSVSPIQVLNGETSATIWADDVTTTGTINKVYALITPPGDATNPLENMLTLELSSVGSGRYEGTYCRFTSQGTYTISVYAVDNNDNVSLPKETQVEQTIASDVGYENYTYFPHIASDNTWETEICIINEGSQSLNGELRAYDNSGQLIDSKCISLTSKSRREIIVGDEFSNPSNMGYIILESDSQDLCGYTKFYIEGKYRVAIPSSSDVNVDDIYISHIASDQDWTTGISLLNTTSSSKDLFIDFDNGTSRAVNIAANEHQAFTIRQLFDGDMQPNINSAVIKNGNGIVGLEIFGTTESSGLNYLSGILLKDDTATNIYYPHIASDSTWGTGIVAYNPSGSPCNLTITPYTENGAPLSVQTQLLDGQEKYIGSPADLGLPNGTAWFSIDASSQIAGFELFSTLDGNQLGGYTGVGISGTDGVFAKIDKDGTGIAFVNIEDSQATVTMTAYDDNGSVIATETVNLNAYEKVVDVPSNLFTENISTATYISYSSDGNIVGFQLNVSSDGMMLDALPGM